jgi:hypothetical protein
MASREKPLSTTKAKAASFDALMPLLEAMFREFQEFLKKKPDGVLNKRKVEIVNRLLRDVLSILDEEASRPYLDLLDDEDLPQNSDVVLILGQCVAAMTRFHSLYFRQDPATFQKRWWWSD